MVSKWTIDHGVARADDVAMATEKNRIALHGRLDLADGRLVEVSVAAIDAKGCATVKQAMHGTLVNPVAEKPRVMMSLAGPVLRILSRARRLLPAGPCEPFYTGSVPAPR